MLLEKLIKCRENGTSYVEARELYEWLEIKKRFGHWVEQNIFNKNYNFKEMACLGTSLEVPHRAQLEKKGDYIKKETVITYENSNLKKTRIDYELTLECAKHLAMVSKSAKGKMTRDYFIECERELIEQQEKNIKLGAMLLTHKDKLKLTREQLYPILDSLGVLMVKKKSVHEKILKMLVGKYENIDKYNGLDITDFKEQYRGYAIYLKENNSSFFVDENQITFFEILGV